MIIGIAELALRVSDLDRAVRFYCDMLGFTVHLTEPQVVFLEICQHGTPLAKIGHPQLLALFNRGQAIDLSVTTFDHVAFEISNDRYDAELARFDGMGMVIRERTWPDSLLWRGRSFFFRDPDGNVIELIAAHPEAEA